MNKGIRIKLNIINIILFILTTVIIISSSRAICGLENNIEKMETSIEQWWRDQAKDHIERVVYLFGKGVKNGHIDLSDNDSVSSWINQNYIGSNIPGLYSAGWVGEINIDDIVSSNDISKIVIKNINGEGKVVANNLLHDGDDCIQVEEISNLIKRGVAPKHGDKVSYTINGSSDIMWVEFNYYPLYGNIETENNVSDEDNINHSYKRYVFVMITKSSYVNNRIAHIKESQQNIINLLYLIMIITCLFNIILMSVLFYKYRFTY